MPNAQALWRFLSNERITPADLAERLRAVALTESANGCDRSAVCVHDGSRINYPPHTGKRDRVPMTHATDVGDALQSSLPLSDRDGLPWVAPVRNRVTAAGGWPSRAATIQAPLPPLDELTERLEWLENQGLTKPLVPTVDREADSVAPLRRGSQHDGPWWVRAKEGARVRDEGVDRKLREVAAGLTFHRAQPVTCQGQRVQPWRASAEVVLARKAAPSGRDAGGKRLKPEAFEPCTSGGWSAASTTPQAARWHTGIG